MSKQQSRLDEMVNSDYSFRFACFNGHLELAKWLYSIRPNMNISNLDEDPFRIACQRGHLEVIKWLYQIKPTIDISTGNEYAFHKACENGHLKVVMWLYETKPTLNMTILNYEGFRRCCKNGHIELAKWFCQLNPNNYYVEIKDDKIIKYEVLEILDYRHNICKEKKEECIICYDKLEEVNTSCGHSFCYICISNWYKKNYVCPYCRQTIKYFVKIV